jgi:hypothetical protein
MRPFWACFLVLLSTAAQLRADESQVEPLPADESVNAAAFALVEPTVAAEPAAQATIVDSQGQPGGPSQPRLSRTATGRKQGIFFRPWDRETAYVENPATEPERFEQTQGIMSQCEGCPVTLPHVGADFFNTACRSGGLVGGAEVVFFKPFQGFNAPTSTLATANPESASFNYNAGQRYWLGFVSNDGLGVRFRYFDYDRGAEPTTATLGAMTQNLSGTVRSRQFDLEMTQQVAFRRWSMTAFGGLRYGELLQATGVRELDTTANTFAATENSFHGLGLTGGLQGQRALGWFPSLSLYFYGRGSLLFGNQRFNGTAFDNAAGTSTALRLIGHNDNMTIWEIGLGPQWQRALASGGSFFARGGVEAQLYQPSGSGTIDSGNMGLAGFTFAMGVVR